MKLEIVGNWFDGKSSTALPARLVMEDCAVAAVSIEIEDRPTIDGEIKSISDRLGTIDRQIELTDGSIFTTKDNDAVDQILVIKKGWFSQVGHWEGFHPRLIAFIFAIVGLFYSIFTYGLPAAATFAAWATPPGVVKIMDDSSLSTLDRIFLADSKLSEEQKSKISKDFDKLVDASGHDARFRLQFRDGRRLGPNALALPAGTIVLTDQLTKLGTHEEIIGVLAHEVAHVTHSHSLKQLYRALGFAGLISVFTGDVGAVAEEVLAGGGLMVAMSASREMELEADSEAVPLLRKIGIAPINLSTMLDKLYRSVCTGNQASCDETGWLSSHPGGKERRKALQRAIEEN